MKLAQRTSLLSRNRFSSSRNWLRLLLVLLATMLLSVPAVAQSVKGTVSGNVTDSNGAAIPGATVTLVGDQKADTRSVTTNDSGRFSFTAIQPGTYSIKIEQKGFQALEHRGVVLSANESLALGDLKLQPGAIAGMVTITSVGPVVEKESSDLTARLTSDQINLISTKGRDITSLLRLLPGLRTTMTSRLWAKASEPIYPTSPDNAVVPQSLPLTAFSQVSRVVRTS